MFAVVVTLEANPGRVEDLISALEANAKHSRTEETCLKWEWSRHVSEPNQFAIYELYTDTEAFAAHKASEHFAEWKAATEGVLAWKKAGQYIVSDPDPQR
ncbi:MAG: putative quinol monooxygenase [Verrucomicrobiales bacterium]|nr:putative quinol monooxygenase [Verrucomicrobiales bacterium]